LFFAFIFYFSPLSLSLPFSSLGTLHVRQWRWQLEPPPPSLRARALELWVTLVVSVHLRKGVVYALPTSCHPGCHHCVGCHHPHHLIAIV